MNFLHRFREFGGISLVLQYARMGMLGTAVHEGLAWMTGKRSLRKAYANLGKEVSRKLVEQYCEVSGSRLTISDSSFSVSGSRPAKRDRVWQCWLQGMEKAPELVLLCIESQRRALPECEFVTITEENYQEWVTLPDYIVEKRRKGLIPNALFSDLLRLKLLIQYGGTWMDATVLCTLGNDESQVHHREMLSRVMNSDLFVMQYLKRGRVEGMSNWFISAREGNAVLHRVLDRLYAYWRDYDCVVEYYIFHLFWGMATKEFPEEVANMPRGNSYPCLILQEHLDHDWDEAWWKDLTEHVCLHKMNFRKQGPALKNDKSFLNHLMKAYLS